jgi:alanine-alpha-ketoisovalerate/valine-pyruvate aminotransferase
VVSEAYNFEIEKDKIKLLTEYESVAQYYYLAMVFSPTLMSGRKYEVILKMATDQ